VKKKRRAVLQAAAGEESKTGEKVDYRAYQALMRGGEEVIDLLKEMTELVKLLFFCFFFLSLHILFLLLLVPPRCCHS
jgi:hypothetical protein